MGKIVAVVNQKGGVGKTTTAVNLTAALTELGKKVLLCDFDPQANATSGLGLDKRKLHFSVYDTVINNVPTRDAIVSTRFGNVLPACADLAGAAVELISLSDPNHRLKAALDQVREEYDLIFIDCPPSLEMLTLNGLAAADAVRILCPGRAFRSHVHYAHGKETHQSRFRDLRRCSDHVRRTHQFLYPGCTRSAAAFSRQGICHRHSPEHPPCGSPQSWSAGDRL